MTAQDRARTTRLRSMVAEVRHAAWERAMVAAVRHELGLLVQLVVGDPAERRAPRERARRPQIRFEIGCRCGWVPDRDSARPDEDARVHAGGVS